MVCSRCGFESPALKTCKWRGSDWPRFVVCDPCYEPISGESWIVPGWLAVWGVCVSCRRWRSVRDLASPKPGGKGDAPGGICPGCSDEG